MSVTLNGTSGLTFNDATTQNTSAFYGGLGFRNRIINGAMMIDQRNAGASVTVSTTTDYTLDRWTFEVSQSSKISCQQNAGSVTPPVGFTNYLGITSLSSYSVGSSDYFTVRQFIEGLNIADLAWGTANAAPITISFWVRSSLTGTFGGALKNNASNYNYPFSYTISVANTWEQKTVTIAGPTSGTWLTTNGIGIKVHFGLGVGSTYSGTAGSWTTSNVVTATGATSVVGTNGATFYITGVQLEKGSTATSFDYRPYGTELALCQRYFEKSYRPQDAVGTSTVNGYMSLYTQNSVANSQLYGQVFYQVMKRAAATVTVYGYNGTTTTVSSYSGTDQAANTGTASANGFNGFILFNNGGSWTTTNNWIIFHWAASSEL